MKILLVMDPGILIPVTGYGGHERLVELFAKEYKRLGHEVELLVTEGSTADGIKIHAIGPAGFPPSRSVANRAVLTAWSFLFRNRKGFDLIHNFGRLIYLLPILNSPVRKIMTYGREISQRNIRLINKFPARNLHFTGCSEDLISRMGGGRNWHTVYNAIDFSKYDLQRTVPENAPLIFLGRLERIKGCHTAIAVAKATNSKLIIAGNISPLSEERDYYEKEIAPHIDGDQINYVGAVNDAQKNQYLGQSRALLFPIEWNEPFGIVMIEAMACGTPVIGFNRGSVPEVIVNETTGIIVRDEKEMCEATHRINLLDRSACRTAAQQNFDKDVIARNYLNFAIQQRD